MDEPFNPYVEWLGLTQSTVKPDHYRLLGLPPFESDARRITLACDGMLAKVRGNRPGAHVREWQALLDELTAARNCLLDSGTRAKYDVQLRTGDEPAITTAPASSSSNGSASGMGFMWPPGFEPPGAKAASAAAPTSGAPAPAPSQAAPTLSTRDFSPPATAPSPSQPSNPAYQAPTTVPVLSPGAPTASSSAAPAANYLQAVVEPSPYGSANTSAPVASPAPSPVSRPAAYPSGNYSNTSYPAPGNPTQVYPTVGYQAPSYPSQGYPTAGMPLASPVPNSNAASLPPSSPYGTSGVDPMAPMGSAGGLPLAQPIGDHGQAAPVAFAAGGYGQNYQQPQMQSAGMNYAAPVAQVIPIGGMATAAMPYTAMPAGGMPVASAVGMNPAQAMPARAAMPVQAIAAAPAEPGLGLKVPTTSTAKAYKQSRKKNSVPMVIAALFAASLLVVAAFFVALKDGGLLALKPELPKSAKDLPIPTDVPPPVDPNSSQTTTEILSPLGADNKKPNTNDKKKKPSRIGPLVEGQTPETMPLVSPEVKTDAPESAIPPTTEQPAMKPEETPPASTASPQETAAVRQALGQALVAMGYRDWDTAKDKLDEAKAKATDDVLKEKVEAVQSVSTGVAEFWRAVAESTKSLGAGQELVIGSTRVAVVEANDKLLILRVGGMNKRYPIDDLPMGLARTLASTWFDNNAASTKVFTGAFLFVEPNGDPAEVRQLWTSAKQEGVNVDPLLKLLEDNLKAEGKEESDNS